jgi:hypothetical protein
VADHGADALVEVEPDRVVHPITRAGVQRADVLHQGMSGPTPITGDQHPTTVRCGDLRDRLGQHLDVIPRGVGPRPPRAQLDHQRLIGVVTPGGQRRKPERLLKRRPGLLFVTVGQHDRDVQSDHGHLTQIPTSDPSGWDPPVPGHDLAPHMRPYPRPGRRDPAQPSRGDLLQRPPHRGVSRPPRRTTHPDDATCRSH